MAPTDDEQPVTTVTSPAASQRSIDVVSADEDDGSSSEVESNSSPRASTDELDEEPPRPGKLELSPSWREDADELMVLKPLWQLSFVSSIIAGYSSIPIFALIIICACNVLYTRIAEWMLELQGEQEWGEYMLLTLRVLALAFVIRNLLVASWDALVDSLADQPTLSPILLRNFRRVVRRCGRQLCGIRLLLSTFHLVCALLVYWTINIGARYTLLSPSTHSPPWLFPLNFLLKLSLLPLTPLLERGPSWLMKARNQYLSFSDIVLYLHVMWPDLLGTQDEWFPSEMDSDTERRALAFNICILVLANLASYGFFTSCVLRLTSAGHTNVGHEEWQRMMVSSRALIMAVTLIGWAISAIRTGPAPSLFSFIIIFSGISINRVILFLLIEAMRTMSWLQDSIISVTTALERRMFGNIMSIPHANEDDDHHTQHHHHHHRQHGQRGLTWWAALASMVAVAAAVVKLLSLKPEGESLWVFLRVTVVMGVCLVYKYGVHGSPGNRLSFFQHAMDYCVFVPLMFIVVFGAHSRVGLKQVGGHHHNSSSSSQTYERPLFYVTTSHHEASHDSLTGPSTTLNVTSIIGTLELKLKHLPVGDDDNSSTASAGRRYGFCDWRHAGNVSLQDLTMLSLLSYMDPATEGFNTLLHHFTTGSRSDWAPVHSTSSQHPGTASFIEFYSASRDLSVVAIRGTNPLKVFDMAQDITLFHGAFTFEVVAQLVPVLRWMPAMWTSYVLYLAHLPLDLLSENQASGRAFYHTQLIAYVSALAKTRAVVLSGHSLGGAIAKIVASETGVPVVSISSPGISLSSKGFNVSAEPLNYLETNLINENDIVPRIDVLEGTIYKMRCFKTNPLHCHQPGQSICELVKGCGSEWIESCRFLT